MARRTTQQHGEQAPDSQEHAGVRGRPRWALAPCVVLVALLGACATPDTYESAPLETKSTSLSTRDVKVNETAMLPLLGYHQLLLRMSAQELQRERTMLAAIPQTPTVQVRLAMLFGLPRGGSDLSRALSLLEGVIKSSAPTAASLHPLARALSGQFSERLKLETQNDKLAQQLKDAQRHSNELQEKLDALADIEKTLPVRPASSDKPAGVMP